jgi:serine/threonine-protein kinase
VCRGISEAHRLGIIHRDIKPHNIFRARESSGTEVWKVLDFGVSKLAASFATITRGGVVGTPQYMSPEQARGETVDVRTDVYGIGAVLYRVLTGQPPIPGKGNAALFNAAHRRPTRPRLLAPDMSRDLEAVLALALARRPADRFQTVDLLRNAFDQALTGTLPRVILSKARLVAWNTSEA